MISHNIYRVDKFIVPEAARDEFLQAVRHTHELLRKQPGFQWDHLLEQQSGPGSFNIVTVAVWENDEAMAGASAAIRADRERTGFDPNSLMKRLNVTPDLGNYRELD